MSLDHLWGASPAADRVWAQVAGLRPSIAGARLFMNLQAYVDDSYDQGGFFVLGGCISPAKDWATFSKEWEATLPTKGVLGADGIYRFKMSEMAALPERMDRVPIFYSIIEKYVLGFLSVRLEINALRRARERITTGNGFPIIWDEYADPFYIAFRFLFDMFHLYREEMTRGIPLDQKVEFYFDEQSQKKTIFAIWDNYIKHRGDESKYYGNVPRFENDDEFLPLQAADFWAWWVREWCKSGATENIGKPAFYSFERPSTSRPHMYISVPVDENAITKNLVNSLRKIVPPDVPILDRGVAVQWQ